MLQETSLASLCNQLGCEAVHLVQLPTRTLRTAACTATPGGLDCLPARGAGCKGAEGKQSTEAGTDTRSVRTTNLNHASKNRTCMPPLSLEGGLRASADGRGQAGGTRALERCGKMRACSLLRCRHLQSRSLLHLSPDRLETPLQLRSWPPAASRPPPPTSPPRLEGRAWTGCPTTCSSAYWGR